LLETAYSVKNYNYLGGAYGKASEREIMAEIKNNGPVVMSFEPNHDFMYYRSGIYEVKSAVMNSDPEWVIKFINKKELRKKWTIQFYVSVGVKKKVLNIGFYKIVGGLIGVKTAILGIYFFFFKCFRLRRGIDALGIESMVEIAEPIIIKRSKSDSSSN